MPEAASRDGLRIRYESFGSGPAVVLLHPANATRRAWADLGWVEELSSLGLRVVTLDARGFGGSAAVSDPAHLGPGSSTADIAAVLAALEIEAAHLCGFSLGAAHALRFSHDHPERVKSLVLGGLAVGPLAQVGLHLSPHAGLARREALRQIERPLSKATPEAREYLRAVQELLSTIELAPVAVASLRFPILGVSGDADPYDPPALYRALHAQGASIESAIIPGAGHGTCFTHPDLRARATRFIASRAGGGSGAAS